MHGFGSFRPFGQVLLASSLLTEPAMMTSSPCFQSAGVATLWFAVSCSSRSRVKFLGSCGRWSVACAKEAPYGLPAASTINYEPPTVNPQILRRHQMQGVTPRRPGSASRDDLAIDGNVLLRSASIVSSGTL